MRSSEVKSPGIYDRNLFLYKNTKSHRFDEISPEIVRELFSHRRSFEYVKEVALGRLEQTICDQLDILIAEDKCDYAKWDKLSKNVFSWSSADYLKRRALDNSVWVDVIKKNTQHDCLQSFKFQADLREIKNFLKLIFQGLQRSTVNFNVETLVCNPLRDAERNLGVLEILGGKNEKLKKMLQDLKFHISANTLAKRESKEQQLLSEIEESVITVQTWDPIETRFEINWYECKTEQAQFKCDLKENQKRKEIDEYKHKISGEKLAGDNIRDTYYALAEQHKSDIDVLQNRLNLTIDDIDNTIADTRLEITKLGEYKIELEKQILKFRQEIKNRLAKEERDLKRLEAELLKPAEDTNRKALEEKRKQGGKLKSKRKQKRKRK